MWSLPAEIPEDDLALHEKEDTKRLFAISLFLATEWSDRGYLGKAAQMPTRTVFGLFLLPYPASRGL